MSDFRWFLILIGIFLMKPNSFGFQSEVLINRIDTTVIADQTFVVYQSSNDTLTIINLESKEEQRFQTPFPSFSIEDFNGDKLDDIVISTISNISGIIQLLLFNNDKGNFKWIQDIFKFPNARRISDSNLYYSYSRNGCADENWKSFLFRIEDFEITEIEELRVVGCEYNQAEHGMFLKTFVDESSEFNKIGGLDLMGELSKWEFIAEFWPLRIRNMNYDKY